MKKLTSKDIRYIFRRKHLDPVFTAELVRLLNQYGPMFKVDTPMRQVRFLSQVVHEVGIKRNNTVRLRESLNYSLKTLVSMSSYFRRHRVLAKKYSRCCGHRADEVTIANIFYDDKNRPKHLRLGNNKPGDGFRYRGAGIFQSTGKYNIERDLALMTKKTGIVAHDDRGQLLPMMLDNHTIGILMGMAHWYRTGMYKLDSTRAVIHKINSGLPEKYIQQRLRTARRVKAYLV